MNKRYSVTCRECGQILADTSDDGLFDRATAHRRAGHHEGAEGSKHLCDVEVAEKTNEYQCPICMKTVTGERARDKHARSEPGLDADSMVRL